VELGRSSLGMKSFACSLSVVRGRGSFNGLSSRAFGPEGLEQITGVEKARRTEYMCSNGPLCSLTLHSALLLMAGDVFQLKVGMVFM
jgi:hypothetical protein